MENIIRYIISPSWKPGRAAIAGLAATIAYSVAMEGDMSLTGSRFSDVRFIEGLMTGKAHPPRVMHWLAWAIHLLNGALLGEIYAAFLKRFLPGPGWLKGAIFSEAFIASAWCLTPLADKHHPMIASGELPALATWTSFWQNIWRHLAFGLALGLFYKDGARKNASTRA